MTDTYVPSRLAVLAELHSAFVKLTGDDGVPAALEESARLREDLGLDSFAALELIFQLEDFLDVRIARSAAVSFQTVGDVVTFVIGELSRVAASAPTVESRASGP